MFVFMYICLAVIVLCFLMLIRNEVVHSIRQRVIWENFDIYYNLPSYDAMLYDLTRWTYAQYVRDYEN